MRDSDSGEPKEESTECAADDELERYLSAAIDLDWLNNHAVPEPMWADIPADDLLARVKNAPPGAALGAAYYKLGEESFRRKNYDTASWSYLAAHRAMPLAAAYVNLGICLHKADRHEAAKTALLLALRHRPDHADEAAATYRNLALLPDAPAAPLLERAVALQPRNPMLHYALGQATARHRRKEKNGDEETTSASQAAALPHLRRAAAIDPHGTALLEAGGHAALFHVGDSLLAAGDVDGALALLRTAAHAASTHAPSHFALGVALQATYQLVEAASALERARALNPLLSVHTLRNDGQASHASLEAQAAQEVLQAAQEVTQGEAEAGHAAAESEASETIAATMAESAGGATCREADGSTPALLSAAVTAAAADGMPVLIHGAARAWPAFMQRWSHAMPPGDGAAAVVPAEAAITIAPEALLPVTRVFEDHNSNRIVELTAAGLPTLPSAVARHLSDRNVSRAVVRGPRRHVRWGDFMRAVRGGRCATCYVKQVRIDMHLPELLRGLRPPRLRRRAREGGAEGGAEGSDGGGTEEVEEEEEVPLGDSFLWMNAGNVTTGLHTDARDNLLVMLEGAKEVLALPASMGPHLRREPLLDVPSGTSTMRDADGAAPVAPLLPTSVGQVHLATTRYLAPHRQVWQALSQHDGAARSGEYGAGSGGAGCRFVVRAPDALFLPSGTIHAVESLPAAAGAAVAAVSFFYGLKKRE